MSKLTLCRRSALLLLATLGVAGCADGTGTVSGVVTRGGRPATGVQVNFLLSQRGLAAAAATDAAGRYTFDAPLDVGTYAVYVTPLPPEPGLPGGPPPVPATADIPDRFRDPARSALQCSVRSGRNVFPVEMAD